MTSESAPSSSPHASPLDLPTVNDPSNLFESVPLSGVDPSQGGPPGFPTPVAFPTFSEALQFGGRAPLLVLLLLELGILLVLPRLLSCRLLHLLLAGDPVTVPEPIPTRVPMDDMVSLFLLAKVWGEAVPLTLIISKTKLN